MGRVELSNAFLRANSTLIVRAEVPPEHMRRLLRDAASAVIQMWDDLHRPREREEPRESAKSALTTRMRKLRDELREDNRKARRPRLEVIAEA